jgi:hypothetical protein
MALYMLFPFWKRVSTMAAKRASADLVKINVRMREVLRHRIEDDARARDISMNAAFIDRVERGFHDENLFGNPSIYRLMVLLATVVGGVERRIGRSLFSDYATYAACSAAITGALRMLAESSFTEEEVRAADEGASLLSGEPREKLSPAALALDAAFSALQEAMARAATISKKGEEAGE